jgi:hypothetical protein
VTDANRSPSATILQLDDRSAFLQAEPATIVRRVAIVGIGRSSIVAIARAIAIDEPVVMES